MTLVRWLDQHPRTRPATCQFCPKPARPYTCGNRCDDHSPSAMRKAVAS